MIFNPIVKAIEPEPTTATITITGSGDTTSNYNKCYLIIDGTNYASATTVEVAIGSTITCVTHYYNTTYRNSAKVYLNDTEVASGTSAQSYAYTVTGDCTIELERASYYSRIYITTT